MRLGIVRVMRSRSSSSRTSPQQGIRHGNIREFYETDGDEGSISRKFGSNGRVFTLSATGWSAVVEEIRIRFDSGAELLLFEMGQYYGTSLALEIMKYEIDYTKAVNGLLQSASYSGWGKISVKGDLPNGKDISVTVVDCISCHEPNMRKSSCTFLRGMIDGVAETLYGQPFKIRETRCMASENDCCEFMLEDNP